MVKGYSNPDSFKFSLNRVFTRSGATYVAEIASPDARSFCSIAVSPTLGKVMFNAGYQPSPSSSISPKSYNDGYFAPCDDPNCDCMQGGDYQRPPRNQRPAPVKSRRPAPPVRTGVPQQFNGRPRPAFPNVEHYAPDANVRARPVRPAKNTGGRVQVVAQGEAGLYQGFDCEAPLPPGAQDESLDMRPPKEHFLGGPDHGPFRIYKSHEPAGFSSHR